MTKKSIVDLLRFGGDAETTMGRFVLEGKHQCFCIEDEYHAKKQHGDTRIPEGEWELVMVETPKWSKIMGHAMISILVPNYTGVLIHPLNNEKQTEGCLGPAETLGYDAALGSFCGVSSRIAYSKLYVRLTKLIKETRAAGMTPTITIKSQTWNPYDEDGNPNKTVDAPVLGAIT